MKNGFHQNKFGYKDWYKNGQVHRVNGPARIYYDSRLWVNNGKHHKIDGPTVLMGHYKAWYIRDLNITDQLHSYCTGNNIDLNNYQNLNKSDKLKLKIKFGLLL